MMRQLCVVPRRLREGTATLGEAPVVTFTSSTPRRTVAPAFCGEIVQQIAGRGVADGHRAGDAGRERARAASSRLCLFAGVLVAVVDVAREVVAAGGDEVVVEAERLEFVDAPHGDPLAADAVAVGGGLLEDEDGLAGAGEDGGEGAATDAAADDDGVVVGRAHVVTSRSVACAEPTAYRLKAVGGCITRAGRRGSWRRRGRHSGARRSRGTGPGRGRWPCRQ